MSRDHSPSQHEADEGNFWLLFGQASVLDPDSFSDN